MPDSPVLACVGNLTIDEAVSPTGDRVESVGGDALFAALAARFVGGHPVLLAPLGSDAPAELLAAIRLAGTAPESLPMRDLPLVRNVVRYDGAGDGRGSSSTATNTSRLSRCIPTTSPTTC